MFGLPYEKCRNSWKTLKVSIISGMLTQMLSCYSYIHCYVLQIPQTTKEHLKSNMIKQF